MKKKKVILVCGMSGAGKTSVTNILEDMGYHCIDQFPKQLLTELLTVIETSTDPRFQNTALSTSAEDFNDFLNAFRSCENLDVKVVFLDASDSTLLHRYKSTRRTHPLLINNAVNSLEEAIIKERELFLNAKEKEFIIIDTTFSTFKELRKKIQEYFAINNTSGFTISFISFGYKHGVPMDADLLIDVRFLPNPYWEPQLRAYSGDDAIVYDYVMDKEDTKTFLHHLVPFMDYCLEMYEKEGKNHLTVGIGCTGGQHRSVTITNYLYQKYSESYLCYKEHRDKVDYVDE